MKKQILIVALVVVMSAQTRSGITPLYNADGTLQICEESEG